LKEKKSGKEENTKINEKFDWSEKIEEKKPAEKRSEIWRSFEL